MENEKSFVMAKRLKELREGKRLSHVNLAKALKDQYGIEISRDSLMAYEVSDPNNTKAYRNEGMKVEYLRCLAEYYGVSVDYLLGYKTIGMLLLPPWTILGYHREQFPCSTWFARKVSFKIPWMD